MCVQWDHSLSTLPLSARAKLRDGKLKLIDSNGDPKLPTFLYDEDTMDGSLTQGLFRGPLLLAVSFRHSHVIEGHTNFT